MAGFRILIGAETAQLSRSLAELRTDLLQFKKQLSVATSTQDIVKLNQAIAQTEKQIKGITGAQNINAINQSVKQLPVGFNQAGFAVGNFSRIAQDAPFALLQGNLIAVSNNIDPLIQSFVQLKQQTGSSGAAFRALGSSLVGSGGLLLGFSLVNAAITFFSARATFAKEKAKELSETIKTAAEAEREAVGSLQGTIVQVQNLANAITDSNRPYKERIKALQELKGINKSYFGDLTLEASKLGTLTKRIEDYTAALINQEIVKKFSAAIADNAIKIAEAEEKVKLAQESAAESRKKLAKEEAEVTKLRQAGSDQSNVFLLAQKRVSDATTNYNAAVEESRTQGEALTKIEEANLVLKTKMNDAQLAGLKMMKLSADGTNEETDALKKRIDALKELESQTGLTGIQKIELRQLEIDLLKRDGIKLGFTAAEVQDQIQQKINEQFQGEFITSRLKVRIKGELDFTEVNKAALPTDNIDVAGATGLSQIDLSSFDSMIRLMQQASELKKDLLKSTDAEQLSSVIVDTLTPAFTDLFDTILDGGQSFLEGFGRLIGQILKKLIATVATAAALAGILSAFGLSFGGEKGFGAIFGKLSGFGFADGGIATSATRGVFGEAGPEAVIPLARLPQIMGQMNNSGGGMGGEFTAKIVDGGRDLLMIMQRENKRANRLY